MLLELLKELDNFGEDCEKRMKELEEKKERGEIFSYEDAYEYQVLNPQSRKVEGTKDGKVEVYLTGKSLLTIFEHDKQEIWTKSRDENETQFLEAAKAFGILEMVE